MFLIFFISNTAVKTSFNMLFSSHVFTLYLHEYAKKKQADIINIFSYRKTHIDPLIFICLCLVPLEIWHIPLRTG